MKIDMHIHTKYSADCKLNIEDIIKIARKRELNGIAITDHNTTKGAFKAKKLANKFNGFQIIPGEEITTDKGEVIGYFLNKEIKRGSLFEVIEEIKNQGGLISIPHPFDNLRKNSINNKSILDEIKKDIDFIEINARCFSFYNKTAKDFADKNNIPLIGGSDAHFLREVGRAFTKFEGDIRKKSSSPVNNSSVFYPFYPLFKTKIYKLFGRTIKSKI